MSRLRLSRRDFIVGSAALAAAAGCNRPVESSTGVFRYPITNEPTTFDPAQVSDGYTIDLLMQIYEGLVGWNEKSEVVPKAAAAMPEITSGGRVYTFKLREGVTFTNGRAITADDVKYSITRSLDPGLASPVAMTYLNDIVGADDVAAGKTKELEGVRVIDPKTVEIRLVGPRPYFLGKLTYPTAYLVAREEVAKGPLTTGGVKTITAANTVGTGPFKLERYDPQRIVTLLPNEGYWEGRPRLNRIERPIVIDARTRRNYYDTGKLDLIDLTKGEYERDKDNAALKDQIKFWDRASVFYLGMNQTHYVPFRDRRVRRAFAHAIDKDAIISGVLLGVNPRAEGIIPIGIPGYDPAFKGIPFDQDRARALLAEAGFPGGKGLPPLTLTFRESWPDLRKTAEVIQQQLAAIGVQISLNEMEWGAFLKATDDRQIDFFHMRWSADYIDPQNFLSVLLRTKAVENRTDYSNPQFDALVDRADAMGDPAQHAARIKLYQQAERIAVDDAPWVPIYFQRDIELIRPQVSGLRDSLMGHLPHTTTIVG